VALASRRPFHFVTIICDDVVELNGNLRDLE